jgi:hypothetical protein
MRSGLSVVSQKRARNETSFLGSDEGDDLKGLWRIKLVKEKQFNAGCAARMQREIYLVWLNSCA